MFSDRGMLHINSNDYCDIDLCCLENFCNNMRKIFGMIECINIKVCETQKEFESAVGRRLPFWVVGFTHNGRIYLKLPEKIRQLGLDFETVCKHELVHIFVNKFSSNCPLWLNEGVAQCLSCNKSIKDERCDVSLRNPYYLTYESGLYIYSRLIVKILFENYGVVDIINRLKTCENFEEDSILGSKSIEMLVKKNLRKGDVPSEKF